jgi:hypothetical protein
VLALGLENREDHQKHQQLLVNAIHDLGATPVEAENQYDLSRSLSLAIFDVDASDAAVGGSAHP